MTQCVLVAVAALGAALAETGREPLRAQMAEVVALTGQVTSAEEGAMEGVLVSARKAGSTITTTVVTDAQGRYLFLERGSNPANTRCASVRPGRSGEPHVRGRDRRAQRSADLALKKTTDLAAQLTNAEWIASFLGTDQQKLAVHGCAHCHTLERVVRSRYDAEKWLAVVQRWVSTRPSRFP
jgi:hypothetical protein